MKKRGRPPRNEADLERDGAIAKAAEHLIQWGFARRTVYECLGQLALEIVGRGCSNGLALSADRIEQIHESWRQEEESRIRQEGVGWLTRRGNFTKDSLSDRRPDKTKSMEQLAADLLRNEGNWLPEWKEKPFVPSGDLEMTPKAYEWYLRTRPRFADPEKQGN